MRRHARVLIAIAALASFFAFATAASAEFERVGSFGSKGSGNGQLAEFPGRAALEHSTGNLFVVDPDNDRVQVFSPTASDGEYLAQFGAGQLSEPWGIAIDEQGGQTTLYVADAGNGRIVRYESDEAATPSFTLDASFALESGKVVNHKAPLAIDPTSHDLLVADRGDSQVKRFGSNGAFKAAFDGSAGAGALGPFTALWDIAASPSGDVYVIARVGDSADTHALRYTGAGSYKAELMPVGPNQRPGTVAVDPTSGEVAVSGNQEAVMYFQAPTLHFFDSSNAPLESPAFEYTFGAFYGLAFGDSRVYAVLSIGENPFGFTDSPRVDVFADLSKPIPVVDPVAKATTTATSAKFTGTVNPNGLATEWRFEYSVDGGGSWIATADESAGAGTTPVAVSADVSGLQSETDYLLRLSAANSDGTKTSEARTFRLTNVREVTTDPATNLSPSSATLNGTINPGGIQLSECRFEYGTSTSYGNTVPCAESNATIGSGEAPVSVHADISGLVGTDYHYRLVATNVNGSTAGADQTFAIVVPPTVSILSGSVVYPAADYAEARIKGRINPGNGKTTYRVEYGPTAAYGQSTAERELAKGTKAKDVFALLAPLAKGTTYHFRIVATNGAATVASGDLVLAIGSDRPADSCPNAAVRAAQGSTRLAECRAWEMVSPLDKGGNGMLGEQISPDGQFVEYASGGALPGAGAHSGVSHYRSARLGSDWSGSLSLDPPQKANSQHLKFQQVMAISEDQSRAFVYSSKALAPGAVEGSGNLYIRDLASDQYYFIATGQRLMEEYAQANAPAFYNIDGSADFSRVVFDTELALTPDALVTTPGWTRNTYEWSISEGLQLATYLPNGDPIIGVRPYASPKTHPYAAGPRRMVYTNDYPFNRDTLGIYLREGDDVIQLSGSQRSGDDPNTVNTATYLGASRDLSVIYFKSSANLTDDSHHSGEFYEGAIYRYEAATGTLTDLTADFGPSPADVAKLIGFGSTEVGEVTQDGEAIYLSSQTALVPEAPDGGIKIYRFTKDDIELVAVEPNENINTYQLFRYTGSTSPNGRYLIYESEGNDTDDVSTGPACAGANAGSECKQIYIYDAVEKTLDCASCDPTGAPSRGESATAAYTFLRSPYRSVTNQGLVGFQTPNPLSSEDVNDRLDVYTWRDGQIEMISAGRGSGNSYYNDMTPDGSSVMFTTDQRLVGRDDDDLADIYVARVNGGFASQNAVSKPPPCEGAECKGPASSAPPTPAAATAGFSGQGNLKPKPKARCGKGSKRVTAKNKSRCVKKKQKGRKGKRRAAGAKQGGSR